MSEEPELTPLQTKIRNFIIAVISIILLIVFVVPLLASAYRGLRPDPTPIIPYRESAPNA